MTRCGACSFAVECIERGIQAPAPGTNCQWFVASKKPEQEPERAPIAGIAVEVTRDVALVWHLQYNHYPPIPAILIPACSTAIDCANAGDLDQEIELPEGVVHKDYGESCPARELLDFAHLWDFVDLEEE